MTECLVDNVTDWFQNNCTETASSQDQTFYNSLFNELYGSSSGISEGIWIPGVNNPTSDQLNFQYLLGDLCNISSNGDKCNSLWTQRCSVYSRDDAENPLIRQFCGCYLPETEYNSQIDRACDFICSGLDQVKFFPPNSSEPQECPGDICLIDNVTIDAVSSDIGNITFQQLCQGCGAASQCRCIISDINLISQNSKIGQINFEENCGAALECFENVNGVQTPVNCDQFLNTLGINSSEIEAQRTQDRIYVISFAIITGILLILFIVAIILYVRWIPPPSP